MKKLFCISISLLIATITFAQVPQTSIASKKAYLKHLEMLFEEGRHCYADIGNKAQLMRVIEAYSAAIQQGSDDGVLTQQIADSLMLYVKINKLVGDYYYLNSDQDSSSYGVAEKCFKNALTFAESVDHDQLPHVFYYRFVLHEELAQLYYKEGRYEEAYAEMGKAEKWVHTAVTSDEVVLDFISQLAICKARIGNFGEAIDDINMVLNSYPDKKSDHYAEALRKKAKILMLQQEDGGTGMADPSRDALKCYKEYFTLKKADALKRLGDMSAEDREQYWMRVRPFVVDCYRTEDADPAFLYDVTLFSKSLLLEYAQSGQPQEYTWKQVQRQLKSTDCAIEFVQYEKNNMKQMGALVLRKKGKPTFVKIGSVSGLEDISLMDGGTLYEAVRIDCPTLKNDLYTDSTNFALLWTPDLLKAIGKNTQRLYFAADGLFHELAIEYMLPKLPELTSLKTENLYRLTSTRELLVKDDKKRDGRVLLCGGIDFFNASPSIGDGKEAEFTNDEQAYSNLKSQQFWFGNLPGTLAEIEGIRKEYDSLNVTLLTDTLATETRAAYQIGQHPIVHLATHGFYLGTMAEGTDLLPASYDESLSQSGIAFAGITSALFDKDFSAAQHDGILSAREIAQMDYSGVDLIVLSACQTAQGYMTDDGIYGLQRSLKNAGVKAMILSLWSVDDNGTAFLMQAFYRHMKESGDIHTAFMQARQDLIDTQNDAEQEFDPVNLFMVPSEPNYNWPEFYNAFILIDIK